MTNIISCKDVTFFNCYLTDFYCLLFNFYNVNKLKINSDKTEILVTCKNHYRTLSDNITFDADGFVINQSDHITILGYKILKKLQNDKQINLAIKSCYYKLHCLTQVGKYLNFKTRLQLTNSVIIGILNYGLPLLLCSDQKLLVKLNQVIIKSARFVIGSYCFKYSYNDILKKLDWFSIYQLINIASVKLFRHIILTSKPQPLYVLVKKGQNNKVNTRTVNKYYPKNNPKTSELKNFFINKMCEIWNSLPLGLHNLSNKNFDLKIKKYARNNFNSKKLHKEGGYITI